MTRLTLMFLTAVLFAACGGNKVKYAELPENKKLLTELKGEQQIVEAVINDANVLYVAVHNDGSNRNGFATYVCEVAAENKSTIDKVKVVQVGTANKENGLGIVLGESECK